MSRAVLSMWNLLVSRSPPGGICWSPDLHHVQSAGLQISSTRKDGEGKERESSSLNPGLRRFFPLYSAARPFGHI